MRSHRGPTRRGTLKTTAYPLLAVHATTALVMLGIGGVAHAAGPRTTAGTEAMTAEPVKSGSAEASGEATGAPARPRSAPPPASVPPTSSTPAAGRANLPPPTHPFRIVGPASAIVGAPARWRALGVPAQARALYSWQFAGGGRYGAAAASASVTHAFSHPGRFEIGVLALYGDGRRRT
ncbi:MAG: PKD domain-containing protein, partial [Actinobacteria bacterium]